MAFVVVTPPAEEPVSMAEARAQCRVDHLDEDLLIQGLIVSARQLVERETQRSLVSRTLRASFDRFPAAGGAIELTGGPVTAISSVAYTDDAGEAATLTSDDWIADLTADVGRLWPAYDTVWPTARRMPGAVQVTYVAGYAASDDELQKLRQAILVLIGAWYDQRDGERPIPPAAQRIIDDFNIPILA